VRKNLWIIIPPTLPQNLAFLGASPLQWPGRLALLAVFLFWIPIVVAISGWTTLSSIQGTVPAVKKFVEAHPTIGSCAVDGGRPNGAAPVWNRHVG
jgi:hypothetical protein